MKHISTFNLPLFFTSLLIVLTFFSACERDAFEEGRHGDFLFSTDTLTFDTIFTSTGTVTYMLVLRNPNKYNLELDSIFLAGSKNSAFVVNVNGNPVLPVRNISIGAGDSIYIFVQAYIPQNNSNNVFIREDSLFAVSGNNKKNVKLIAFGRNVITFRDTAIKTQEWSDTRPYLVYGTLIVDAGSKLTIREGTRVFLHKNARILIQGKLEIAGTKELPVKFSGSRTSGEYDTIPGQWGGIFITGSQEPHRINYAELRNATVGLQFGSPVSGTVVEADISNTIIANVSQSALSAYHAKLTVSNTVLVNSGNHVCFLAGGNYTFIHCTLGNYGARYLPRSYNSRTLILQNFTESTGTDGKPMTHPADLSGAYFGNSIIYGSMSDEIALNKKAGSVFHFSFENCLIRTLETSLIQPNPDISGSIFNKNPNFLKPLNEKFQLDTLSPAKDAGKKSLGSAFPLDMNQNKRTDDTAPDLGAYERIE